MKPQAWVVLDFWFSEEATKHWWSQSDAFDQQVADQFGALHARAAACELWGWRTAPDGRLAEVIVLDQFSRHLFRGTGRTFQYDALALALAQESVSRGDDRPLPPDHRAFLYMPFMHSESLEIHETALKLFSQPGLEKNLDYERRHLAILERFGRYPHRNAQLGRTSTPEELAFLQEPGSSF
jgi:uncharacterized protein (DUF924 family)